MDEPFNEIHVMMKKEQPQQSQDGELRVNCSEEKARGTYANIAIVQHSVSEFILDFLLSVPGRPSAEVESRVILSPDNAKRLMHILHQNIERYEAEYGEIPLYELKQNDERIVPFPEKDILS